MSPLSLLRRPLTTSAHHALSPVLIQSITPTHLKLSTELHVISHDILIASPSSPALLWRSSSKDVKAFEIFRLIHPRPDLLIVGTTDRLDESVREWIHKLGIQLSVLDPRNAAATYNLLVDEGRSVALALRSMTSSKSSA